MPTPFLYDLFLSVREELKLPLGIEEYHALLEAVEKGMEKGGLDYLQFLCETIWIKKTHHKTAFRALFQQQNQEELAKVLLFLQQKDSSANQNDNNPSQGQISNKNEQSQSTKTIDSKDTPTAADSLTNDNKPAPPSTTESTNENAEVLLSLEEAEEGVALGEEKIKNDSILSHPYILSDAYHPINEREMRQSWRFLRQPSAIGQTDDIDIPQTIRQFAKEGFLSKVLYQKAYEDDIHLLLLIDYKGSMVAFHTLADQLITTAHQEEKRRHIQLCYFHDVPKTQLFLNPARTKAIRKEKLFRGLSSKHTRVLIFSDAGAARGQLELARIDETWDFLDELRPNVRQIVWLNPVPRQRWAGTTAAAIAEIVTMLEVTQSGFRAAIRHLRGKTT
ncbi:MAG: hypothetical protein R2828_05075 [Saprospiraceae bacterium]